ncbi:hypothetical protein T10_11598 [Trichinella papuae]|uniref:Uncharacterized protein n=1 Tax=Trichinella papuae TaxID=268474 RepID=A0A0V1N534_9BILA|nr:hypothetical protein T10_11598 [Trichinella papuae]
MDVSKAELVEDLEEINDVHFSLTAYFWLYWIMETSQEDLKVFLLLSTESYRYADICLGYAVGRIFLACAAASDFGRLVLIRERITKTDAMGCILRSPEIVLLVFSRTYSVFSQLMLSVCAMIPVIWQKTPYKIREKITDRLFQVAILMSFINTFACIFSVMFKTEKQVSSVCFFDYVVLDMFATVFWIMIVIGCYIAIGLYFVAFYYTKRRQEELKTFANIQVRDVHSKEVLFIKHLLPIVIVNILFEAIPYTIRALVPLHFLHPKKPFLKLLGFVASVDNKIELNHSTWILQCMNAVLVVILDYGKEPRRIKNIFASHTLGRILIAATLASDYGRQIVIGERLSQTKPIECILRSPELIFTYSAFAQLMLSVCILIPALRPKTPYLIREHITDQMFLLSLFMSSINVVGSVISVFFKDDVDISSLCSFDQVLLKPYALFQWTFITVCFHISIAIYVTAFYLTQKQEARRKEINNSQVREVLLRELLFVKHLLPIFVLSVPFELLPHTVRTFIAYGYIDRRFYDSFAKN